MVAPVAFPAVVVAVMVPITSDVLLNCTGAVVAEDLELLAVLLLEACARLCRMPRSPLTCALAAGLELLILTANGVGV